MSVSPPRNDVPPASAESPLDAEKDTSPGLCPRCETPYDSDQEYCLECGLRLPTPATGVVANLGGAWRQRFGWYPGDWLWPSLLALVIAIAGGIGAVIYNAQRDQKSTGGPPLVRTNATGAGPTTAPSPPPPTPSVTGRTGTSRQQRPKPPPPRRAGLTTWPPGKTAWTVFLSSNVTRSTALASARKALQAGFMDVGVVDTSQYSSLHPGYFEVFTGMFDSQSETGSTIAAAHSKGYLSAYPRRITP